MCIKKQRQIKPATWTVSIFLKFHTKTGPRLPLQVYSLVHTIFGWYTYTRTHVWWAIISPAMQNNISICVHVVYSNIVYAVSCSHEINTLWYSPGSTCSFDSSCKQNTFWSYCMPFLRESVVICSRYMHGYCYINRECRVYSIHTGYDISL